MNIETIETCEKRRNAFISLRDGYSILYRIDNELEHATLAAKCHAAATFWQIEINKLEREDIGGNNVDCN